MNRLTHWLPHALLLVTALLSAWFAPVGSAATPGTALAAGMTGRTLLRTDEALALRVADPRAVRAVEWRLDGRWVGDAPALTVFPIAAGDHALSLTYQDAAGQRYALATQVRVLQPHRFAAEVAALQMAIHFPLFDEDDTLFIPQVIR
ncbi:MAG: hypothetical protein IT317_03975 [Anaerolineales bacterium]|nr:hypothetical protein [Anaerolineales bacterium]